MHVLADHAARITEIQTLLRSGAKSVTTDGTTVELDHDTLRRELRQLMAEDDIHRGRRPVVSSIDLSGF